MITFFVALSDGNAEYKRKFLRESLPRIGEEVKVAGSYGKVTCVWHDLGRDLPPVVDVDLTGVDFKDALAKGEWEKSGG